MDKTLAIWILATLSWIMAGALIWMLLRIKRRDNGSFPPEMELQMLDLLGQAAVIMRGLGPAKSIDESDFLGVTSKLKIENWLREHRTLDEKLDDIWDSDPKTYH